MPLQKVTDEVRGEIKDMTKAGVPAKQIAEELEVSIPTIYRILGEEGLKPAKATQKMVNRLSEEELDHLLEMYLVDWEPVSEILFQFDLNHNQLYQLLGDLNIEPRRKQPHTVEAKESMIEHALDLYLNNPDMTVDEIVQETGVSQPTIHNEIARRNLDKRRPRRAESAKEAAGRGGSYRSVKPDHAPKKGQAEPGSGG